MTETCQPHFGLAITHEVILSSVKVQAFSGFCLPGYLYSLPAFTADKGAKAKETAEDFRPEAMSKWVVDSIKRIPAGKKEHPEAVKGCKGLTMISRANGSRSWVYSYWHPDQKKNAKVVLGHVKVVPGDPGETTVVGEPMTLRQAKELATSCRRLVREGRDPKPVVTKLKADFAA